MCCGSTSPEREVWAFGSRTKNRARRRSDLDLAIGGPEPLPLSLYLDLKEDFLQSDLPYFVDLLDLADTTPAFRGFIEPDLVPISHLQDQLSEDLSPELPFDKLREECGVMAVYNHPDAARLTYWGLYSLQHRGQESGGIASADGEEIHDRKGMGLVSEIFTDDVLETLPGHLAIGHTRYSTTGDSALLNAQPISVESTKGLIAIAHNGNLINLGTAKRAARARRRHLPDHVRLRNYRAADRALGVQHADRLHGRRAPAGRRRVFDRADDAQPHLRGARSARLSPALHRADRRAGRRSGHVLLRKRNLCARPAARTLRARRGARRTGDAFRRRHEQPPLRQGLCAARKLHFRARVLCPAGLEGVRALGADVARRDGPAAGARVACGRRPGGAGARLRRDRGDRLRGAVGDSVQLRADPQPLRGAHLHRADAAGARLRRAHEAEPRRARCSKASA